jgi:chromate reductase
MALAHFRSRPGHGHHGRMTASSPLRLGYLVGSIAEQSINRRLAGRICQLASADLRLSEISIMDLPLYRPDFDDHPPQAARRFKKAIEDSDALLFLTPEYNRSVPGALKNALDWGSRPWGDNSWRGKPAVIAGTGLNSAGSAVAQSQLRSILGYLQATLIPAPEICLSWHDAVLADPATDERLTELLDAVRQWAATPAPAGVPTPADR